MRSFVSLFVNSKPRGRGGGGGGEGGCHPFLSNFSQSYFVTKSLAVGSSFGHLSMKKLEGISMTMSEMQFQMQEQLRIIVDHVKAVFHQAEFSTRSDIFFCLKTNWRSVGVKRKKKISFRMENST